MAPPLLLMRVLAVSLAGLTGAVAAPRTQSGAPIPIPDALREAARAVPDAVMQSIYDEVKTPYKYGVVLRPGKGESVDCPNVFRHDGRWYMLYVGIQNEVGYETRLAVSDDLLSWTPIGTVLPFRDAGWDRWQADGSLALVDPGWGGSAALQPHDGRYWVSYFGGAKQGYEPDPLSLGLAWTRTPTQATPWTRLEENPVLTPDQPDARPFERATIYKSHVLWDRAESLGYPFVMYYNAKQQGPWIERIGMAVSRDMVHWSRYGHAPVIDNGTGISGDPQIVRMGDVWVMFYFGAGWKPGAFDTFAVSYDLVHWTKWTGRDLIAPSLPWDKTYAHKPWVLKHDGVVYHFYCAVGTEGRTIAVATSRDLRASPLGGGGARPAPASGPPYVPSGRIDPTRVNVLSAADAQRSDGLSLAFPVSHLKPEVVGWTRSDQSLRWTIDVPTADLYTVNVLIGQTSGPALDLRVSAGRASVTSAFRPDPRGSYSRSPLERPLSLARGRNAVTLHVAPRAPGQPFAVEVLAVELVRPSVRDALHAEAMALRADARWMPRARYGVMFHWTKRTMPRSGPPRSYADAAEAFDVERFADQVASTGAGFVVLTTAHSDQYLPAPILALDRVLPGRTTRRDLIGDLIGALERRGIRLVLYYHLGPIEDPEWARATGLWETDSRRLFDNWQAIVGEVGERYGEKLAGWWFDDGLYNYYYRSPDWAALDRAAKRGHPGRVVCFNSWKNTSATEFQDFHCGEELVPDGANAFLNRDGSFGGTLVAGADGRITGGAFAGLQAAATFMMESEWVHLRPDTAAAPPKRSPAQLAELIRRLRAYGATPIINMLIYQDGEIAPRSLASLQEARALLASE